MKIAPPLPLKEVYFSALEKEVNRLFYEIIFKPIVAVLGEIPKKEIKNAKAPLYVRRPVLNAEQIIEWAKAQGFSSTLKPSDLHVTICRSRAGVESKDIEKIKGKLIVASKEARRVARLGEKGAVVLFFRSSAIEARWLQLIQKHGASWDYDSFHPHITLTYNAGDVDLAKVEAYDGPLVLGDEIHRPIINGWSDKLKELKNSADPLTEAIRSGRIYVEDGKLYGDFNAKTSKALRGLGATFHSRSRSWTLPRAVPAEISMALADADMRYTVLKNRLVAAIDSIRPESVSKLSRTPELYETSVDRMDEDFKTAVKRITIPARLTAAQKAILAQEWGQNLNLYIQKWIEEDILELRQKVQQNVFAGRRAKSLVKGIQQNYGVSKRKAEFLARQETSLLLSKFREQRFKSVGSTRYRWRGTMDGKERHDHKELEGQIFFWDNPPIVDKKTGRRANPGEDFNCRCVAEAIID